MGARERIKEEMKKRGMSQNKLAKAAQISQSGLSSILNGDSSPKENTIRAIADALNIPLSELMEDQVVNGEPWDPAGMNYAESQDETIRIMTRGMSRISPANRQTLLDVARAMFGKDFDEEGNKRE